MYSGAIAATIGRHDFGVAMVTSPAPDRSAPMAARCAAPDRPSDPAMTSTRPKSPLCESAARAGTSSRIRSRVSSSMIRPLDLVEQRERNADVGDHEIAAVRVGRRQDERDLRRRERHRHRRFDRLPFHIGGVGGDAGRQIDRDDRHAEAVHVGDDGLEQSAELSVKAGARGSRRRAARTGRSR